MDDPDEIAAALRGTELDGLAIEEGLGETWVVTGIDPDRLLPAWRAARAAVPEIGRCPVVTMDDALWQDPTTEEVEALSQAARTLDPWTVYRWYGMREVVEPHHLHVHLPPFLAPRDVDQARRDLRPPTTTVTVERWVWERIVADPVALDHALRGAARLVGTRRWYTPTGPVQIVLLPTPNQWLAPAWLDYFGATEVADGRGRAGLAAAMRQWQRQWGAELVACWGTMLQFVVARQPALGDPAWQLAIEHLATANSLQAEPWELALALTRSDAWFLHDRP
jgi:hypothetical protein